MAAAVPRLDLGQDGDQAYSPSSAPFGPRPAARTPAGRSLLMSTNPLFDQPLLDSTTAKPALDEGEQTPRLAGSGKLSDLKGSAGPVSSARKWLAGQARSPVGAALAGSMASPARVATSPVQLPAAAAAHLAADAPTPRLLASAGKLTPRTDTGVAPSPATQFPRSFPVAVAAKAAEAGAAAAPAGGLATWLRMSSHLSKPSEAATELASPAGSDASEASSGSSGTRTRTVASLDFQSVEQQPAAKAEAAKAAGTEDSTPAAAPAVASEPPAKPAPAVKPAVPAAKPAPAVEPAVPAAPKATQSAAVSQPTRAGTQRRSVPVRSERSSLLSLPAVQLVLLCLLGPLLLAAPLAMRAFNPTLTQRYLPGHMPDVAAHFRKLSAATSQHASQLSAAATRHAGQLKAAASHSASQLHAAALRQAQQAGAAAQQAQQAVKQAYNQRLAAATKAAPVAAVPAQPTTKPAPAKAQQPQQKQQLASNKKPATVAKPQATASKPQPTAASQQTVKAPAPAVVKAPVTQPKQASVPASSLAPAAVKPQVQPAAKTQAAAKPKPQATAAASQPAAVQPATSAKLAAKIQPAQQLYTQAAAFATARLAPAWQQLRARLPFMAPPAAPVAVAEATGPRREVQASALAAAAAAAVAGLAALAVLGWRAASGNDAATAEEEALDEEPAALPAFPTTTPAVGGRASRTRRQSEAVIAEAEDGGLPSVVAPRQRRASALPAATPGTAPRTSRRKSAAAPAEVPASPTSTVTTRRRSMRLAA